MVADDPEDCQPATRFVTFTVDHRPSARVIEEMILSEFHVSKAMKPEITKMAMKIALYTGDYYLEMAKLMRGQPEGTA